jgi:hypothetical protein
MSFEAAGERESKSRSQSSAHQLSAPPPSGFRHAIQRCRNALFRPGGAAGVNTNQGSDSQELLSKLDNLDNSVD